MIALACLGLAACAESVDDASARRRNAGEAPGAADGQPPDTRVCTMQAKAYIGFGSTDPSLARRDQTADVDRARVKPFTALAGEYARVLGRTPESLASKGAVFDEAQPRWYQEPKATAGSVYTSYAVAFDGCLSFTSEDARFAEAPTATSAESTCRTMARRFWSRAATDEEVGACVAVAMTSSAAEPEPRRRWAYTCASVLGAAGFSAY